MGKLRLKILKLDSLGVLCFFVVVVFCFVCGTGICAKGFALAKQVLYHLSHFSSPFCSGDFGDGVSQ
jgi:hypothetical protein